MTNQLLTFIFLLSSSTSKQTKTNVIYFDPHKLQMTDHFCYLNLGIMKMWLLISDGPKELHAVSVYYICH